MPLSAHQTGTNPRGTTAEGGVAGLISGDLAANTPEEFLHGMAKVPAMVIITINAAAAAAANHVAWDVSSSDGTQITLVAAGACDFVAVCLA